MDSMTATGPGRQQPATGNPARSHRGEDHAGRHPGAVNDIAAILRRNPFPATNPERPAAPGQDRRILAGPRLRPYGFACGVETGALAQGAGPVRPGGRCRGGRGGGRPCRVLAPVGPDRQARRRVDHRATTCRRAADSPGRGPGPPGGLRRGPVRGGGTGAHGARAALTALLARVCAGQRGRCRRCGSSGPPARPEVLGGQWADRIVPARR